MDAGAATLYFRDCGAQTWERFSLQLPEMVAPAGAGHLPPGGEGWSAVGAPVPSRVRERMRGFPALIKALASRDVNR